MGERGREVQGRKDRRSALLYLFTSPSRHCTAPSQFCAKEYCRPKKGNEQRSHL